MLQEIIVNNAMKMQLMILFQSDISAYRFNEMQRLYDATHISTSRLLDQLHKHRPGFSNMLDTVFIDIAYILIDEITENEDIESLFEELYDKRYPDAKKYYKRIENEYNNQSAMYQAFQTALRYYIRGAKENYYRNPEFILFSYYIYKSKHLRENEIYIEKLLMRDAEAWVTCQAENNEEYLLGDYQFRFTVSPGDSPETIFDSKMFEKFVRQTKKRIAGYLSVSEENLNNYIHSQLKNDLEDDGFSYLVGNDIPGLTNISTIHVIQDNYGTAQWFHTIESTKGQYKGSFSYRPDIDKIFKAYCRSRVEMEYLQRIKKKAGFPKSALLKACRSESPEIDYRAICYLYNIDIVYQMFRKMQERYYADFSWEQVTKKNALIRNNEVIEDLRHMLQDKENTIASLSRENEFLNSGIRKQDNSSAISHLQELQKLSKIIRQKDDEILLLNKKLAMQEEFIDMLNTPVEDTRDSVDQKDISVLQAKRYLFVGFADEALPDLRKVFPNSVFMNTENIVISNINVDAVVYLIRYMSHGMLYKIRSEAKLADTPFIYCNGRSLNSVYSDMLMSLS